MESANVFALGFMCLLLPEGLALYLSDSHCAEADRCISGMKNVLSAKVFVPTPAPPYSVAKYCGIYNRAKTCLVGTVEKCSSDFLNLIFKTAIAAPELVCRDDVTMAELTELGKHSRCRANLEAYQGIQLCFVLFARKYNPNFYNTNFNFCPIVDDLTSCVENALSGCGPNYGQFVRRLMVAGIPSNKTDRCLPRAKSAGKSWPAFFHINSAT